MRRRVCYVSGTRADFGLMQRTLIAAAHDARLDLSVCVTGMHLSGLHGETVREIEATGIPIAARVPLPALEGGSGAHMGRALGQALVGIVDALSARGTDAVMVLGDRGEMLAGALAALHLNIPTFHVHGGERSGTVDEPVRHAISKLAHVHCVSTAGARERLVRMGERPEHVIITGAPGLDGLAELGTVSRRELCAEQRFDPERPVALVLFHPVLQEAEIAGTQLEEVLSAVQQQHLQALCFTPNSDAGSTRVRAALERHARHPDLRIVTHIARARFVSWMAAADVMVGNSSAGIIEAASLGLPVVNVGSRQNGRERSDNVTDVPHVGAAGIGQALAGAVRRMRTGVRPSYSNVYGDGHASARIVELLATFECDPGVLYKTNAY